MTKKDKAEVQDKAGAEVKAAPVEKKEVQCIGVMTKKFMQCTSYGPHIHDRYIKCWPKGEIVWKAEDVAKLKELKAPMRIFSEVL